MSRQCLVGDAENAVKGNPNNYLNTKSRYLLYIVFKTINDEIQKRLFCQRRKVIGVNGLAKGQNLGRKQKTRGGPRYR
jgi:hypothetical protein